MWRRAVRGWRNARRLSCGAAAAERLGERAAQRAPWQTAFDQVGSRAAKAQEEFSHFDQERTDRVFAAVAKELNKHRLDLAKAAVAETKMGLIEDKTIKNAFAAEHTFKAYKDLRTCGVLSKDYERGIEEVAIPVGPIAAILPVTNPTSTVIAKSLVALKSRNAVVFLPHPKAAKSSQLAAHIAHTAAVKAGAPENCIQCLDKVSMEQSAYMLSHSDVNLILATGGPRMLQAAYTAGKPAIGVGAGNAPVIVDETANLKQAVSWTVLGKTFDNGMICASEQSTVVVSSVYDRFKELLVERGVLVCAGENREKLQRVFLDEHGSLNHQIVGMSAARIAEMAGINYDREQPPVALAVESKEVERDPFSIEKLSPILSMYRANDYEHSLEIGTSLALHGGQGHTAILYSQDTARQDKFKQVMPANHLAINMPSAGVIGLSFNLNVNPTMTLGCGTAAGSAISGNLSPMHLVQTKQVIQLREHIEWYRVPNRIYFNRGCTRDALRDLDHDPTFGNKRNEEKRVMIVTDQTMVGLGYVKQLENILKEHGFTTFVFSSVAPDPDMCTVLAGARACEDAKPNLIVAFGGGSPLDAAKIIRLFYEYPESNLEDLATRFVEIRNRTSSFPQLGSKVKQLICIPTTSGTGSEVTPFAVITDNATGRKFPICDYSLTPDAAIVDANFTDHLPAQLVANAGFDTLVHAVESYVSIFASEFSQAQSLKAFKDVVEFLPDSYRGNLQARERVHHAACIAGMAFSNAFLGINHSLAHALGSKLHLSHGLAISLLFDQVVRFNASKRPAKMAAFSQYPYPVSQERYDELAQALHLDDSEALLAHLRKLRADLGMPLSIRHAVPGMTQEQFESMVDDMANDAFDDQCTGTNPRYPLIDELKQLLRSSW